MENVRAYKVDQNSSNNTSDDSRPDLQEGHSMTIVVASYDKVEFLGDATPQDFCSLKTIAINSQNLMLKS